MVRGDPFRPRDSICVPENIILHVEQFVVPLPPGQFTNQTGSRAPATPLCDCPTSAIEVENIGRGLRSHTCGSLTSVLGLSSAAPD